MLTGIIHDPDRYPELNNLVAELKRTHVCRYPIKVVSDGHDSVNFIDERWPDHAVLALSMTDKKVFVISSELISNDKYSYHNDDYHTRKTNNLAKARRWLKEYVNPFEGPMITHLSHTRMDTAFRAWRDEFSTDIWATMRSFNTDAIAEDYINYLETGIPYQSTRLNSITQDGFADKYRVDKYRKSKKEPKLHVLVSPDDMVSVSHKEHVTGPHIGTYRYDQIPANIKENVALLKISPVDQFIEGVGVALNRCNFWVYE
jgi:hypothetical protein